MGLTISTHAPLTGCDSAGQPAGGQIRHFNPRTPHGVRPMFSGWPTSRATISTHAPLTGCDGLVTTFSTTVVISIHAPLTGCDDDGDFSTPFFEISIHAPLTGCDDVRRNKLYMFHVFQSTHPSRGATIGSVSSIYINANFNPRTPHGVRLHLLRRAAARRPISIHAPLTGCDTASAKALAAQTDFNPRTPHGVRLKLFRPLAPWRHFNPRTPHGVRPA